jgi:hypothetical protein
MTILLIGLKLGYNSITTWITTLDFNSYPNILPQSQRRKVEIVLKLAKSSFW